MPIPKHYPQYAGLPHRSVLFLQPEPGGRNRFHPTLIIDFSPEHAQFDQRGVNLVIHLAGEKDMVIEEFFLSEQNALPDVILKDGSILSGKEFFRRYAPSFRYHAAREKQPQAASAPPWNSEPAAQTGWQPRWQTSEPVAPPVVVARYVLHIDERELGGETPVMASTPRVSGKTPFAGLLRDANMQTDNEYGVARLDNDGSISFTLDPNYEQLLKDSTCLTDFVSYQDVDGRHCRIQIILTTDPETPILEDSLDKALLANMEAAVLARQ